MPINRAAWRDSVYIWWDKSEMFAYIKVFIIIIDCKNLAIRKFDHRKAASFPVITAGNKNSLF